MKNFAKSVPYEITESGKIDGAGDFKIFVSLIFPMLKPALATVGLFLALGYWNEWYQSSLFLSSKVDVKPLQYTLYEVVNKMDQPGTEKEFILGELQAKLNSSVTDFSDLQSEEFYEQVSLCEEEMLNQYLEQGEVEVSQIAEKISERKIFPCVFGSALRMEGVKHLLEVMQTLLLEPSYDEYCTRFQCFTVH